MNNQKILDRIDQFKNAVHQFLGKAPEELQNMTNIEVEDSSNKLKASRGVNEPDKIYSQADFDEYKNRIIQESQELFKNESEKDLISRFNSVFQKSTSESWNLLMRNAKDGGANSVMAGRVLEKSIFSLKESNQSISEMQEAVGSVSNSLIELHKFAKNIQQLSDQSKFVSFNAQIEASRAGEFGVTFAVVADSISGISEKISRLTDQITKLLTEADRHMKNNNDLCAKVSNYIININSELVTFNKLMIRNEELSNSQSSAFEKFIKFIAGKKL